MADAVREKVRKAAHKRSQWEGESKNFPEKKIGNKINTFFNQWVIFKSLRTANTCGFLILKS